ncbi:MULTISPECIES: LacI family DNA-binding transcriptional regulator [Dyadobacter]|uniref:LacI family transcriptional regulator n=1 Tax=Dyadobacter chenhuakuii TaxID=2909339 RepID=A0A9X1QBR2_9BACT|nr:MULTISPECIES: LacI family DNA-binding transcriptional regulator [Dyadobacter]MCE7070662.1 LacI family transcriptional regulator [Dyadobacter sp. CY327]MCF2495150.1 LacI family transcriptional regulator [Dyadobacter chenhuakuii]MCF2498231.1 LacI family transcriptional regulator [Dyadobacter chenhuakuii]MCF2518687.1 LacI family transcriptional regulator [Dyadobacter sp. CY351]USJ31539.1 LacI family transcriptional regulator [Dyadobacter chenhuakuii]
MKKISLKDIAQKAGVSTALVSYVLNGKEKETRVGEAIAKKVREIAKELNYQPNHLAKSLRSGKTHTIGLIIADISNPFFANIARVVEDEAKRNGYTVIIGSCDENAEKSWDLLNVLINRQVDGFIIVSCEGSENQIRYLKERNLPFVLLDRHFPDIETDFVATNNYKASYDAGIHLIESGYERIGLIAYQSEMYHMVERIRGYKHALNDNNIAFDANWLKEVTFENMEQEVKTAIDAYLAADYKIEALIFATYGLAINGLKYINELRLKVPSDLAIVSFGQAEVFDLYYCPITYLRQPLELLGKTSVEYLLKKMKNPEEGMKQTLMEAKLIARDSSMAKSTWMAE